jgi:hypothetical protein
MRVTLHYLLPVVGRSVRAGDESEPGAVVVPACDGLIPASAMVMVMVMTQVLVAGRSDGAQAR